MTVHFRAHDLAPFAPNSTGRIGDARRIERLILEKGLKSSKDGAVAIGQLLTAAIIFGALLDPGIWKCWMASVGSGMHADRDGLWIEFNHDHPNLPARWFADPLTETLLRRWKHEGIPQSFGRSPRRCISDYFEWMGLSDASQTAAELERIAESKWRLRMPAMLVEVAKGNIDWRSVPDHEWRRIVSRDLSQAEEASKSNLETATIDGEVGSKLPSSKASDPPRKYNVRTALEKASTWRGGRRHWLRKADALANCLPAVEAVRQNDARSSFIERMLNAWVLARLSPTTDPLGVVRPKAVSPAWAWQQVRCLEPVLEVLESAGGYDGSKLNSAMIAGLYRTVIRSEDAGRRQANTLSTLTNFQDYLEAIRPDICVLFDEYEDIARGEENVSSHLVSPAVYAAARESLRGLDRADQARRIFLMLGYRAGLRCQEAEALLVSDFFRSGPSLELRIRANPHFTLKSPAARRRIPLNVLLPPDEEADLVSWLQQRERECGGFSHRALLLCDRDQPARKFARRTLCDPVENLLKKLSANDSIVYHHLRHSFATYAMAALLLPEDWPRDRIPQGFDDFTISVRRRERLTAGLIGRASSGQYSADALGTVLGHRDNRTTFLWYTHLMDWSVGQNVRRPLVQPGFSAEALEALIDVTASSIRRRTISAEGASCSSRARRKRGRRSADDYDPGTAFIDTFLRDVRKKWPIRENLVASTGKILRTDTTTLKIVSAAQDWRTLSGALSAMDRGSPPDEVAERFGLDAAECVRIAQDADLVSAIITSNGRRRFRFAGWINARETERAQAPGLKLIHGGRKRATRREGEARSDRAIREEKERKRLFAAAVHDVQRMDGLWPKMVRTHEHHFTRWTLQRFLEQYSEPRGLISFRGARDAARYIRGLRTLGIDLASIRVRGAGQPAWQRVETSQETKKPSVRAFTHSIEAVCSESSVIQVRVTRADEEAPCPAVPYLLLLLATMIGAGVWLDYKRRSLAIPRRFQLARLDDNAPGPRRSV